MGKKKKNHWFSTILPLLVAFGALTISIISYYDSNLKIEHNVQVNFLEHVSGSRTALADTVSRNIVLMNRGNQDEVITKVQFMLSGMSDSVFNTHFDSILGSYHVRSVPQELLDHYEYQGGLVLFQTNQPFVLEAGQVKVLSLLPDFNRNAPGLNLLWIDISFIDENGKVRSQEQFVGHIILREFGLGDRLLVRDISFYGEPFQLFDRNASWKKNN